MSDKQLEHLKRVQLANADVMTELVRTAFAGFEQLAALNLATSREFLDAAVSNAHQILGVKDPQDLARINANLAKPNLDKMLEYSRSLYSLTAKLQKDIGEVLEKQVSSFTHDATSAIEKAGAGVPLGGDVFASAMRSLLEASNKSFDNLTQITRQFAEITDANISAATRATAKAADATTAAASAATKRR
jgi:phasin family protein